MKYKLLKDTPTIKAGAIFQEIVREVDSSKILKEYDSNNKNTMLVSEIKNFDEWFEEITDSIHWKPRWGDKYYHIDYLGYVHLTNWEDDTADDNRLALGFIYLTEEACRKAKERKLAKVRLQRTSDFKPDFKSKNGGWVVGYNYHLEELVYAEAGYLDYGEPVRYATEEDTERSIKENERDWKIYFGVEE